MRTKIAAVLILILVFFGIYKTNERILLPDNQTYEELFGNIAKITKSQGVARAHKLVVHNFENGNYDINQCHSLMHVLGHAAYEFQNNDYRSYKIKDFSKCMDGFLHGVEAQIVLEELIDLDRMSLNIKNLCEYVGKVNKGVECYHGAGHAFLQKGFSPRLALEQCDKLIAKDSDDCYRGVFSEYVNFLRGVDGDSDSTIPGVTPIKLEPDKIFRECFDYDSKYRNSCISQFAVFLNDLDGLKTRIDTCNLYDPNTASICTLKVGANYAADNLPKIPELKLPEGFSNYNPDIRRSYITGVVGQYLHYFGSDNKKALSFCESLDIENDKKFCFGEAGI